MQRMSRYAHLMPRLLCFFPYNVYRSLRLIFLFFPEHLVPHELMCHARCLITTCYYLITIANNQFVGCEVILSQAHARLKRAVSIAFSMPSGEGGWSPMEGTPFFCCQL